ncbi:MAG: site-2 protease family protein [Planctomycetota bacterium]
METPERYSAEEFLVAAASEQKPADKIEDPASPPRRYGRLAIVLAIATVFSTFFSGVLAWEPLSTLLGPAWQFSTLMPVRQAILANWVSGLQFSLALMAILVAHEFGHYILTRVYNVPSTPPLFIPFPIISPIGTMGAVILMQSGSANRKQIFDIGLAGPLAGLVVAIPVIAYGILNPAPLPYSADDSITLVIGQPLLVQWMAAWLAPEQASEYMFIANSTVSPFLMAGWVGLLVTGINMMPMGQLDGGHVTFGLVGDRSHWIARGAMFSAIAFMIYNQVLMFALMLVLVFLMGLRHPPSSDDTKALGLWRQIIGWASLTLPILCIPARPLLAI